MRVGLVLGAGGVVGASWLIGALEALEAETGWTGAEAERIVGTSAGSVIGALTAAGVDPELMGAYASGASLDGYAEAEARAGDLKERYTGSEYRLTRSMPPLGPGSWRLIAGTLRHPRQHNPAAMLAGWLPRGFVSTAPIQRLVESYIDDDWPAHPGYWAVAADYATGKRVAFGSEEAPPARVGEAVAASCAIPGFYHPPKIGGRRYIDGGICSNSNLDLVAGQGLDLVVCLNPMSSLVQATGGSPADRFAALMRAAAGRRVGHEARKLREEGTKVVILQPGPEDIQLMGLNLMSGARRLEVMEQARRSTARELRGLRGRRDVVLPGRARTRRPVARKPARRAAA
jgi:NTE family protein